MTTEFCSSREVAQRFCDDVVMVAGCFKPNAPGRWELSGFRALSERQLLKSRGAYFAERLLVAVTPIEVVAISMDGLGFGRPRRRVWSRSDLVVQTIPARAEQHLPGPALRLSRFGSFPVVEIVPVPDDDTSGAVIEKLLGGRPGYERV
ncbi:MAG: hypothetical protein ACXVKA_01775 [Acidimicrobiia bacterium]